MTDSLKVHFQLDPGVIYLNHGSFGACPKPVFEAYQRWQRELERQPMELLHRRMVKLMGEARSALAAYIHCAPDEVVYFPNPTTAINMVVRSLKLEAGDEVLSTDHEYGAMDRTWRFICGKHGAALRAPTHPAPSEDRRGVHRVHVAGLQQTHQGSEAFRTCRPLDFAPPLH